jgi:hypothetical protein
MTLFESLDGEPVKQTPTALQGGLAGPMYSFAWHEPEQMRLDVIVGATSCRGVLPLQLDIGVHAPLHAAQEGTTGAP